jgi:hypothetical protein
MNCNEHHIICKAVGDGWICTACETRYMPMSEHDAKVAEEIAKWKGIVKGVHGALNDIGTVIVPAMDADLYDAVMSIHLGGLSVDEAMEVTIGWRRHFFAGEPNDYLWGDLRARLIAKAQGK